MRNRSRWVRSGIVMVRGDAGTTRVRSLFAEEIEDEVPAGETLTFVLPKD